MLLGYILSFLRINPVPHALRGGPSTKLSTHRKIVGIKPITQSIGLFSLAINAVKFLFVPASIYLSASLAKQCG
jgi:hypothetical protein